MLILIGYVQTEICYIFGIDTFCLVRLHELIWNLEFEINVKFFDTAKSNDIPIRMNMPIT